LLVTIINFLFPAYIVLRVLVKVFLHPNYGLHDFLLFEEQSVSKLGSLSAVVEAIGIIYIITSAFVGFYKLPFISFMKPRVFDTSMYKIAVNVAAILFLSSSFPVVAKLLGLTSFDLMGYYHYTQYLKRDSFHWIYKSLFMLTMTFQYYKLVYTLLLPIVVQLHQGYHTLLFKLRVLFGKQK